MKDKKMIEEIAKDIPYLTLDRTVFVSATETKNVSWTLSEEDNKVIAEVLVEQGYRKLAEDSVVLAKEEYDKLLEQRRKARSEKKRFKNKYLALKSNCVVLSREEYENIYEQAEQNVLANISDGGTSCQWCIEQHEKKASKETVEKIIDLIKTFCPDKKFIEIITRIISERFGVEIKD